MKLVLKLEKPISGYWNGGTRTEFEFAIESTSEDSKGPFCRIGCFDANYWFHVDGKGSEKKILSNVKRKFAARLQGVKHAWKYEEK